jgi:N-acetylmuramoyl-L-alanine amidase
MVPKRVCVLALLVLSSGAAARSPEEAYQAARNGSRALKADPAKKRLRHHWINAARQFERFAAKYPEVPRAAEALFCAAQLFDQLSKISKVQEDRTAAAADYQKVIDRYPNDSWSDAAALGLARMRLAGGEPAQARRVCEEALARHPRGASAGELKTMLRSLPVPARQRPSAHARVAKTAPAEKGRRAPPETPPATRSLLEAIARASSEDSAARPSVGPRAIELTEQPSRVEESGEPAADTRADAASLKERSEQGSAAGGSRLVEGVRAGTKEPAPRAAQAPEGANDGLAEVGKSAPTLDPTKRARSMAARSRSGDATLAEQLGLKVQRVVIDPGHGGHDTGAVGARGTREKDVALSISLQLRDLLAAEGLQVALTREGDSFVRLEDRAKLANEARGDLFISIHCNSARKRTLRGVETYTLNTSSDRYSIRLAARENASSERGISDLQYILADLATKANTEESSRLSAKVQQSLVTHLRAKHSDVQDLGTKEALFYVLLGVRMPAILVEVSFLSNAGEEQRLSSKAYQRDVAAAIAAAVRDYLGGRQRLAKVN